MNDYMIRATAAGGFIRAFATYTKSTVEEARSRHSLSPIATAALGRTMTAALMMGSMLKGDKDIVTIQILGIGPLKGLTVTADSKGHVKGYTNVTDVVLPGKNGKLDVGGSIMPGYMSVTRDLGLKEPYASRIQLQTGEIGDDLAYYFAVSEQVPSSVGVGVLFADDVTVKQAGGFIIQLMPNVPDEIIDRLSEKLEGISSVTRMLDAGMMPEDILEEILGDFELEINDRMDVSFKCDCSKERIVNSLLTLPKSDLEEMIDDKEPINVHCHFCNTDYSFEPKELKELI